MDSTLLVRIHSISVMLFLLTYVIKTVLLFTSKARLAAYTKATRVPEMIISTAFLVTGVWLFIILGGIKFFQILKLIFVILSIPLAVIAFKRQKGPLALLSLLLIIGAYGLSEMSKNKPFIPAKVTIAEGTDATKVAGFKVYLENCTFCHGQNGKKQYRNAPDLTQSAMASSSIQQMVREGSKGKMPAYNLVISDENIAAVAAYVETMRNTLPLAQ
jgi:mono/diheme cytochrome c family protein